MSRAGLQGIPGKRGAGRTRHEAAKPGDLLKRQCARAHPNQLWVTDVTKPCTTWIPAIIATAGPGVFPEPRRPLPVAESRFWTDWGLHAVLGDMPPPVSFCLAQHEADTHIRKLLQGHHPPEHQRGRWPCEREASEPHSQGRPTTSNTQPWHGQNLTPTIWRKYRQIVHTALARGLAGRSFWEATKFQGRLRQICCSTTGCFVLLLQESVAASQLSQVFCLFSSYPVTGTVFDVCLAQPVGQGCRGSPKIGPDCVSWFSAVPGDFYSVTGEPLRERSHDNIRPGTPSGIHMLDGTKTCTTPKRFNCTALFSSGVRSVN